MSQANATRQPLSADRAAVTTFAQFHAHMYLCEYYSHVGAENRALLEFLQRAYATIFAHLRAARLLEFGGGPTIYQLISASHYPVTIDFSDYLGENLAEVQAWLDDAPGQFGWDAFVRYALACEQRPAGKAAIERRKRLIRSRVSQLLRCDAKSATPLGSPPPAPYDIVSINFVLESITQDRAEWQTLLDNVAPLIRPCGYVLMSAILGATRYRVGQLYFPAVPITLDDIYQRLAQSGFTTLSTQAVAAEHRDEQGYAGIGMVLAKKEEG